MAKGRTKGLIDEISRSEFRVEKEYPSWHVRLKKTDENKYKEVREVCLDFLAGGVVEQKFRTVSALHRFLCEKGFIEGVSYQQFKDFIASLKN